MVKSGQVIYQDKNNKSSTSNVSQLIGESALGREQKQKIRQLILRSGRILLRISTVFPFDLFPDVILIDENKIELTHNVFFESAQTYTIPLNQVFDVSVETSIFFATLVIVDKRYVNDPYRMSFLKKDDALRAKKIISGLIIGKEEGIDLRGLNTSELTKVAEILGGANDQTSKFKQI